MQISSLTWRFWPFLVLLYRYVERCCTRQIELKLCRKTKKKHQVTSGYFPSAFCTFEFIYWQYYFFLARETFWDSLCFNRAILRQIYLWRILLIRRSRQAI